MNFGLKSGVRFLSDVGFIDDLALMTKNLEELGAVLTVMREKASKVVLNISQNEAKIMSLIHNYLNNPLLQSKVAVVIDPFYQVMDQ